MKNNNRGFTLIEIVMVLVLLGILAALAIPKYYDLKAQAEVQTAKAVAAECQARVNGAFAAKLLDGEECKEARKAAIDEGTKVLTGDEKALHGFTVKGFPANTDTDKDVAEITFTMGTDTATNARGTAKIALPVCKKNNP